MGNVNPPYKLTRPLFKSRELYLRIHVMFGNTDTYGGSFSEFTFDNKTSSRIDPGVYLTLDIKKTDSEYDPSLSVVIGKGTLHMFKKSCKRLLDSIYEQHIFANKGNTVVAYQDMVEKYSETITVPRTNSAVLLKPAVVYDENEVSYEGVNVYINKLENMASLFIDEYESLVNILLDIDLFVYSQLLVNYYVSYYGISPENNPYVSPMFKETNKPKISKKIDWETNEPKVESNFRKPDTDIFNGIQKLE